MRSRRRAARLVEAPSRSRVQRQDEMHTLAIRSSVVDQRAKSLRIINIRGAMQCDDAKFGFCETVVFGQSAAMMSVRSISSASIMMLPTRSIVRVRNAFSRKICVCVWRRRP